MKADIIINIINGIYEQLVRYKEQFADNEGVCFMVTIHSECLGFESDGNTRHSEWRGWSTRYVHVMLLQTDQVFMHVSKEPPRYGELPQRGWENTSNHDSCGRQGLQDLIWLGFDCWDEAHKNCPEKFRPATRDDRVTFRLQFGSLGDVFKLVRVKKVRMNDGYHSRILEVKEIKGKLVKDR